MRRAYWTYLEEIITESDPETDKPPEPGMFAKAGKRFWGFMRRLKRDNSGIAPLREGSVLHVNSSKKAEILNKQYCDQFTDEDLSSVPEPSPSPYPSIPFLNGINPNKAQAPDELPAKVL